MARREKMKRGKVTMGTRLAGERRVVRVTYNDQVDSVGSTGDPPVRCEACSKQEEQRQGRLDWLCSGCTMTLIHRESCGTHCRVAEWCRNDAYSRSLSCTNKSDDSELAWLGFHPSQTMKLNVFNVPRRQQFI